MDDIAQCSLATIKEWSNKLGHSTRTYHELEKMPSDLFNIQYCRQGYYVDEDWAPTEDQFNPFMKRQKFWPRFRFNFINLNLLI